MQDNNNKKIITGDFNSKSFAWSSPVEDARGVILAEWLASLDLVVLNNGNTPTFIRNNITSYLDITACSQEIARKVLNWEVLTEENLSDHNTIKFEINIFNNMQQPQNQQVGNSPQMWIFQENKRDLLKDKISEATERTASTPTELINLLQCICEEVFPRKTANNKRKPSYWWNSEIAKKRKNCFALRRKLVRLNSSRSRDEIESLRIGREYHNLKKDLRRAILQSKSNAWKKLCLDLNDNVWGTGYRIVCKKLKLNTTKYLSTSKKLEEADKLFPQQHTEDWEREHVEESEIPPFCLDELLSVCTAIKNKKAPGPDGIVPEITKELIMTAPNFCLEMFNNLLKKGCFPDIWKIAKLVLIEKPMKPTDKNTSYRPICLLDGMGKVFERLLKKRLEDEIVNNGGLSPQQYGFIPGRSTVDAMLEVKKIAKDAKNKKKLCVMTAADVKNAFNSVPWKGILEELKNKNISKYLRNIMADYFTNRKILIDDTTQNMTCGAPQGSVLGALMWNIYYDPILRLKMPPNTRTIAYADDLVLLTIGERKINLELEINLAMIIVNNWMKTKNLQLAPQKTEMVMLISSRAVPKVTIEVEGVTINSKNSVRYLGVEFDKNLRMTAHIKIVSEKAERVAANLSRLMPNISGPNNSKRSMLASVVWSTLFYGIPVWLETANIAKYRNRIEKVQRKMMIRQCRSYRTVSTVALQVISGTPPVELMALERTRIYHASKENINLNEYKSQLKEELLEKWQTKWNDETVKGQWTKKLIKNIKPWVLRQHGDMTFELSQFFTGHGNIAGYLHRLKINDDDGCIYCNEPDTSEQMAFECSRWDIQRTSCWQQLGTPQNPSTIVEEMLKNKKSWSIISKFIIEIFQKKLADTRRTQAAIANTGSEDSLDVGR